MKEAVRPLREGIGNEERGLGGNGERGAVAWEGRRREQWPGEKSRPARVTESEEAAG